MNIATHLEIPDGPRTDDVSFRSGEYKLRGRLIRPSGQIKLAVVLNPATGVPARFYEDFAEWLAAEKQAACLIYDYRDFGWSLSKPIRRSQASMADWGVYDQEAAREFLTTNFPDAPLWVIGHSLGTICLPFQRNLDQIDRVIAVCSGLVHVRDHPWPYQALARLFWFGPIPIAAFVAGYLPARALGLGKDLPSKVYWQWRRWCTRHDFYAREMGNALPYPDWSGLTAPAKIVAVADDVMTPPSSVWRLMRCFPQAPKTQLVLRPGDFGLSEIGHIGVFSNKCRATWKDIVSY